jgi:hypothetical protein
VATTVLKKLPGVLSFQRGTLVTDGLFFNQFSDGKLAPLPVVRHGIRGTQNINKLEKSAGAGAATAKREEGPRQSDKVSSSILYQGPFKCRPETDGSTSSQGREKSSS